MIAAAVMVAMLALLVGVEILTWRAERRHKQQMRREIEAFWQEAFRQIPPKRLKSALRKPPG